LFFHKSNFEAVLLLLDLGQNYLLLLLIWSFLCSAAAYVNFCERGDDISLMGRGSQWFC